MPTPARVVLAGLLLLAAMLPSTVLAQNDPFVSIPEELTTQLTLQVAYNGEDIVWRFQWPARGDWFHDMWVFEGGKWVRHGNSQVGPEPDGIYEDRLTFLVDPGTVSGFPNQGCYTTCHAGSRFLSNQLSPDTIKANPFLGGVQKRTDLRKYIPDSRVGDTWWAAPWDQVQPKEFLDTLAARGVFLDFWHWRAHRGNPMGYSDDQVVLEYRKGDAGKGPYTTNWNAEGKHPQLMFDPAKVGVASLKWDDLRNKRIPQDGLYALTTENSIAFDPNRAWQEGDVIPRQLIRVPDGSHGTIRAEGSWRDGMWTLVLRRAMDTGFATDDHALLEGRTYTIGFAVHKGAQGSRWHYVSMPQRVGIGVPADVTAVRFSGATPDWGQVPSRTLPLWYPSQVTWEWLTSDAHPGAAEVRADTRSCASCHGETAADVLKLSQAAVYHEGRGLGLGLNWWLTLIAVVGVIVGGTFAVLRFSRK